jgi:hypothetical protein
MLGLKRKIILFLNSVNKLDAALRLVGKGTMDVNTTVRLAAGIKSLILALENITFEDVQFRQRLEEVIKRAEEN